MSGLTADPPNILPCPICEEEHPSPGVGLVGNHNGSGGTLGGRIMQGCYGGGSAHDHPLSCKEGKIYSSAQAHHLICLEVMRRDEGWIKICKVFGYDIDCCKNGAFLPGDMRIACELQIPLHRGHHSLTRLFLMTTNYVEAVRNQIDNIKGDALAQCDPTEDNPDIINRLNSASEIIWNKVINFLWVITKNGIHFINTSTIGCSNEEYLSKLIHKRHDDIAGNLIFVEITNLRNCGLARDHNIKKYMPCGTDFKQREDTSKCQIKCMKGK